MKVGSAEIEKKKSNSAFRDCSVFVPIVSSIYVRRGFAPASVVDPPVTQFSYIQTLVLSPAFLLNCKKLPSASKGAAEYRSPSENSKWCYITRRASAVKHNMVTRAHAASVFVRRVHFHTNCERYWILRVHERGDANSLITLHYFRRLIVDWGVLQKHRNMRGVGVQKGWKKNATLNSLLRLQTSVKWKCHEPLQHRSFSWAVATTDVTWKGLLAQYGKVEENRVVLKTEA